MLDMITRKTYDDECVVCEEPFSSLGGILTTKGWICYTCVSWMHAVIPELRALAPNPNWMQDMDNTP